MCAVVFVIESIFFFIIIIIIFILPISLSLSLSLASNPGATQICNS